MLKSLLTDCQGGEIRAEMMYNKYEREKNKMPIKFYCFSGINASTHISLLNIYTV